MSAAPVTLEGWYVLHSMYAVDWPRWNALGGAERDALVAEATALLERQSAPADGQSGCWTLLGHKGDLCLMHWRRDLEALRAEEVALARTRLRAFLVPTYSYLSVIELGT
ncbi:MAG: heme-dependent peroxidase, partial [Deltaproteobacteria bacterium]